MSGKELVVDVVGVAGMVAPKVIVSVDVVVELRSGISVTRVSNQGAFQRRAAPVCDSVAVPDSVTVANVMPPI